MVAVVIRPILVYWHESTGHVVTSQRIGIIFSSVAVITEKQSTHTTSLTAVDLWSFTLLEAVFDFCMLLSSSVGNAFWDLYQ